MALLKVNTKNGTICGLPAGNQAISVFKGIPYAAPPVGNLRWREPQPCDNWVGELKAYSFPNICYQRWMASGSFYQKEFWPTPYPMSEDCLYLNVWTPAVSTDEKLPVAFWIHGGGLMQGFGHKMEIDGEAFAKEGVVFVSINYRLNVFGLLAHPELSAESGHNASGNYALLDMIMALKWVKENISAFGGDPDKVTIFGQSGGAAGVQMLIASPLADGLFARAIMQSGGGLGGRRDNRKSEYDVTVKASEKFLEYLGVNSIEEARKIPGDVINEKYLEAGKIGVRLGACVDGYSLPEDPLDIFRSGKFKDVEVMVGSTRDESGNAPFPQTYEKYLANIKASYPEKIAEKYLEAAGVTDEETLAVYQKGYMKLGMWVSSIAWCENYLKLGRKPAYLYQFVHEPPGDDNAGVFHSSEHMYLHNTMVRSWRPYTGADFMLGKRMRSYWTNFIKTGDPNGGGFEKWTPYTKEAPLTMMLDNGRAMEETPMTKLDAFLVGLAVNGIK